MILRFFLIKEKLRFGDQDVLNILFASSPENIFDLPCHWNLLKNDCETKDVSIKTLNQTQQFEVIRKIKNIMRFIFSSIAFLAQYFTVGQTQ